MTALEHGSTAVVLATGLLLMGPVMAQAPASPDRPWAIPASVSARAGQLGEHRDPVPKRPYGLAELIDLAERTNPQTRAAWEVARRRRRGGGAG